MQIQPVFDLVSSVFVGFLGLMAKHWLLLLVVLIPLLFWIAEALFDRYVRKMEYEAASMARARKVWVEDRKLQLMMARKEAEEAKKQREADRLLSSDQGDGFGYVIIDGKKYYRSGGAGKKAVQFGGRRNQVVHTDRSNIEVD